MVYCLKRSAGFKNHLWGLLVLIFAGLSLTGPSWAMRTMATGVAYSIWVAFGSIGSLGLGALCFHEKINCRQLMWVSLLILAVIGLKIVG